MNTFIKKVVVAAIIITTAGVAGASQARADGVQYSSGYWTGGAPSGGAVLGVTNRTGGSQFSFTLRSGSDIYAAPQRKHRHKKFRKHDRSHKAKRHQRHRHHQKLQARSQARSWYLGTR